MNKTIRNLLIFTSLAVVSRACVPGIQDSIDRNQPANAITSPVGNTSNVVIYGEEGAKIGTLIQDDLTNTKIRYFKKWDCKPGDPLLTASQEWTWIIKGGKADGQVKGIDCTGLITDPAYTYYRGEDAVITRSADTTQITVGDRVFSWVK